jgi:hypothetical protein
VEPLGDFPLGVGVGGVGVQQGGEGAGEEGEAVGALLGALPVGEDRLVGVVTERLNVGEVADGGQQASERARVGGTAGGLVERARWPAARRAAG